MTNDVHGATSARQDDWRTLQSQSTAVNVSLTNLQQMVCERLDAVQTELAAVARSAVHPLTVATSGLERFIAESQAATLAMLDEIKTAVVTTVQREVVVVVKVTLLMLVGTCLGWIDSLSCH